MRAPSSAKATFAGSEHDASLSSLLSSALCIGPCVAVCRAGTSCPALCMFPDVCLGSRLAFSELIRIREGRPCTGLYPCVPWMRKPEANDASCPSWAQKPQGESGREGGKSRGAPAHVPLRNGTQAAAAAVATCSRLQEISWQVPLNRSWDIREALRRTCRRRRRRPRCCRRRCRRWHQAEIPGVPWSLGVCLANFTLASPAASFSIVASSAPCKRPDHALHGKWQRQRQAEFQLLPGARG